VVVTPVERDPGGAPSKYSREHPDMPGPEGTGQNLLTGVKGHRLEDVTNLRIEGRLCASKDSPELTGQP
jgi:hypothetical protein